jgi:hypothetical protein
VLDNVIQDLTLHGLSLGPQQNSIDLRWLLYKGAATTHGRNIKKAVESGLLGKPKLERLPLLIAIHGNWQNDVTAKRTSTETVKDQWLRLRAFVAFAERVNKPLTIAGALDLYLAYCAYTKRRSDLKPSTQYAYSLVLAGVIAPVLDMDSTKLQWKTKIRQPKKVGNNAAKENLQSTASFVQTLLEAVEQLPVSVIRGPLPVTLRFASGGEYSIHCGPPLKPAGSLKGAGSVYKEKRAADIRESRASDLSNSARARLINLRLDAEMLVFINQTGCNLTQALRLTGSKFRYQSEGDYLRLFIWKGRAKHEVELRIHKSYRRNFEDFLKWRSVVFPGDPDGLTFPFVWNDGDKALQRTNWAFQDARNMVKAIGQPFVHSRQLRKTVGNFVKRKISRQFAAELLGNTEKTFRESYEEVHHQVAVAELVNFWRDTEAMVAAIGPGGCQQPTPKLRADAPVGAPKPDCESGGGCLFCDKNRDLRSFDHAWNLASLHFLKIAEFNADRTPQSLKENHPVALTIDRIAAKLDALKALGGKFAEWVTEANLRVQEGRYHPFYTETFDLLEDGV